MRFFRRRRNSPETTQVRTDVPSNFIPGCWIVRWNSAFSSNAFSRNSLSESVTQYVPKCITSVSQSDILCGDRVENFSSDCWLQNHLDQFGNRFQRLTIPEVDYDEDDDSPVGSTASTEANSISSFEMDNEMEDEIVNRLYYANRNRLLDFPSYTEVVEPPPYGFTDLPPSYEEAIAGDQDRLSRRFSSSSSGVDFIWY